MSTRDNLVQVAIAEAALRASLRALPVRSKADARRWAHFSCQCVRFTPGDGEGPHPSLVPDLDTWRDAFWLAERWSSGKDVATEELEGALRWITREAPTMSAAMSGPAAGQWAVLSAVEAVVRAANFGGDSMAAERFLELVENAARYARLARGGTSMVPIGYQARLRDEILRSQ
jgi:hypothetical protein